MAFDIIGDVHGHAEALVVLLRRLGYRERAGAWRHPTRSAIFVGDLIDRGPQQVETVALVRDMVEAGSARVVMGNHEFNALGYHSEDPLHPGQFLRAHNAKNNREHRAFLEATAGQPDLRRSILGWFMTLPLWLELPELRVVHACWDAGAMAILAPMLRSGQRLGSELLIAAHRRGTPEYDAAERVLKGVEVPLPSGQAFFMGYKLRDQVRTRWWNAQARTFRASALVPPEHQDELPDTPLPAAACPGYPGDRPLFIGHYQLHGAPFLDAARVACVDWPDGGRLTCYRWDGERDLQVSHYIRSTTPDAAPAGTPPMAPGSGARQPTAGAEQSAVQSLQREAASMHDVGSGEDSEQPCILRRAAAPASTTGRAMPTPLQAAIGTCDRVHPLATIAGIAVGCMHCWAADAAAAWKAYGSTLVERVLVEEPHYLVSIRGCRDCGQRYVAVMTERIDWKQGNDPIHRIVMPIGDGERAMLEACTPWSDGVLAGIGPRRQALNYDWPEDADARVYWDTGIRALPHD